MSVGMAAVPSLIAYGFALGWSVAWPPGPINAEIVRRGLAGGFWPPLALLAGACLGDATWAAVAALGVGVLLVGATVRLIMEIVSVLLLLALAYVFLRGAWRGARAWRAGKPEVVPGRFERARGGFLLGLTMAVTGPWNFAFWLAVMGRPETLQLGLTGSLVVAAAVLAGAATWGILLCTAVVWLRLNLASPAWELCAKGLTGALMLYFAARSAARLIAG